MLTLLSLLLTIGFLFFAVVAFSRTLTKVRSIGQRELHPRRDVNSAMEWVSKYGMNSNSFLTLYDGFQHFVVERDGEREAVAFVETPSVWTAATEPFAAPAHQLELLDQFREEAKKNGKSVMMLPVSESFAQAAKERGYDALMIGSEPLFEFARYNPDSNRYHSAKAMKAAGAEVRDTKIGQLSTSDKKECDKILTEWLNLRWMAPLSFLNRVHPWEISEHKRYFILYHAGRIEGFLAAIPVFPAKGWYLVDLLRRSDSPAGTSELILMDAMKTLKAEGAAWACMGLSPLSRMDLAPKDNHPFIHRVLKLIFERGNSFYRFKPLFEFKEKFQPTSYPPRYLLLHPKGIRPLAILSLLHAFVPGGIVEMAWSGVKRQMNPRRLQMWIQGQLNHDCLVRLLPKDPGELVARLPVTLLVLTIATALHWFCSYRPDLRHLFEFSLPNLERAPVSTLLLSPMLHVDGIHLVTNLLMTCTGVVIFELLAGSTMCTLIFVSAALVSNPITMGIFSTFITQPELRSMGDVGISLGIFAVLGALCRLLRYRYAVMAGLLATTIAGAIIEHQLIFFNHATALIWGYSFFSSSLRRPSIPHFSRPGRSSEARSS